MQTFFLSQFSSEKIISLGSRMAQEQSDSERNEGVGEEEGDSKRKGIVDRTSLNCICVYLAPAVYFFACLAH